VFTLGKINTFRLLANTHITTQSTHSLRSLGRIHAGRLRHYAPHVCARYWKVILQGRFSLVKKVSLLIQTASLITMLIMLFLDIEFYSLLSVYCFLVIWCIDKVVLFSLKEEFGVANQLKIKADAPPAVRIAGVSFVSVILVFSLKELFEHVAI